MHGRMASGSTRPKLRPSERDGTQVYPSLSRKNFLKVREIPTMRYAMFLPGGSPEVMIAWARQIEAAGFDSLWQGELVNSAL
jgi:hypothetical protein